MPKALGPGPDYPGLVILDAMFTIFTLIGLRGQSRREIICQIYREFGRIPADIPDQSICSAIDQARIRGIGIRSDPSFWTVANMWMLEALTNRFNLEPRALAINRAILGDVERYRVSRRMRLLLAWLKARGFRVVIGSNQWTQNLVRFVKYHEIELYIDALYTSESLGVRKPDGRFWTTLLNEECWPDDRTVCHIGNSPWTDAFSYRANVWCLLWDTDSQATRIIHSPDGLPPEDAREIRTAIKGGKIAVVRDYSHLRAMIKCRFLLSAPGMR